MTILWFRGFTSTRYISCAKKNKGTIRHLSSVIFLFLCNPPFPGDCLAPLSQHGDVFNPIQGKRTLGRLDRQNIRALKLSKYKADAFDTIQNA